MAAAKTRRGGKLEVAARLDPAGGNAGLRVGQVAEDALTVLQKGFAFKGDGQAPGGAHQELDAQAGLQGIEAAADDGGRHACGAGGGRKAAPGRHGHEGFDLLEMIHQSVLYPE